MKQRLAAAVSALALLAITTACGKDDEEMSWGALEGDGQVCGVFAASELREVLSQTPYRVNGRHLRAAAGERPADAYCWVSGPAEHRALSLVVEPPGSGIVADNYADAPWLKGEFDHAGLNGRAGYRSAGDPQTGWAVVETDSYVAGVFLDGLPEGVDGADEAQRLVGKVVDRLEQPAG